MAIIFKEVLAQFLLLSGGFVFSIHIMQGITSRMKKGESGLVNAFCAAIGLSVFAQGIKILLG